MSINKDMWQKPSEKDIAAIIQAGLKDEPYDFPKTEIDGVPVYIKNFDFAPCIHIRIGFRYGAIHDDIGKEGTAHFLEHMLFDGSDIFDDEKDTQEFGKTIMLDSLNAYTGLFELFVTGKTLPHNFETALTGIFSMILRPKLTEKSWAHEQKVITQEAWGRFLNEKRVAYLKKEKANTLYSFPDRERTGSALGWPETVLKITHQDIVNAHKNHFIKENMEIYLAGNIEAVGGNDVISNILKTFIEQMPSGKKARPPYVPTSIGNPKVPQFDHTYEEVGLAPKQQTAISLEGMVPRFKRENGEVSKEERSYSATLALAGELMGDLVFRKLRLENSWCYGAGASTTLTPDYMALNIGGSIDANHVDEALGILWGIVDELKAGEFKTDFQKSKYLIIENTIARERNTGNILDNVVEGIKANGAILKLKDFLEDISKVTFEDVQRVVALHMQKDIVFTEIIRPNPSSKTPSQEIEESEDVE